VASFRINADFEAVVHWLSEEECGLKKPPRVGYRPSIWYEGAPDGQWIAFSVQMFDKDRELEPGERSPPTVVCRFWFINRDFAHAVHRERMQVGTRFLVMEGGRAVGRGEVTKLLGEFERLES
jgi:translation elongation factor EF-Tu-like GTPase